MPFLPMAPMKLPVWDGGGGLGEAGEHGNEISERGTDGLVLPCLANCQHGAIT